MNSMTNCLILCVVLTLNCVMSQDSGTAGNPRGQHCRGFNAEEIRKSFYLVLP